MPAPAAMATMWRALPSLSGRTKRPWGGMTSSMSPADSVSLAQTEKRPPATRLMAMRRAHRRGRSRSSSCGAAPRRRAACAQVRCWPGLEAERVAQRSGTANVTEIASGVSRFTSTIVTAWKSRSIGSDALEIVERLGAGLAAPMRLAGGRAELGDLGGRRRAALRAGHGLLAEQRARAAAPGWAARCRTPSACGGRPR